jgi:xylulokinase
MGEFLVGCDVGTGGAKAVVMAADGAVLGSHFIEYPLITAKSAQDRYPGAKAEQDPEWYWNAAADTIRVSLQQARVDPKEIRGVCMSALAPACILIDRDRRPLQNAHIWMDRRATAECAWLRREIGEDRIFQVSGNLLDPFYGTPKVMWERNNRPELYQRAYKFLAATGYACLKLTGKATIDYSNACVFAVAFDIAKRRWDEEMIEAVGLDPAKFPTPYPCDEVVGEVTREAAARTGLAPGTPVVAGTVDANAGWVAAGAVEAGDTQLLMGTSGVMGVVQDTPTFARGLINYAHAANSRRMHTTAGALASCGGLIRYFRDQFGQLEMAAEAMAGISAYEILSAEARHVPPGSNGLIVLPYFMGERTPIWDPHARGVIFGLSLDHGRGHLVRALMEGAGYALRHNFEIMQASGLKMNLPLVLSEGGACNPLWRQIIADILNVECVHAASSKGAPVGDAVVAGVGVGVFKDYNVVKDWVQLGPRVIPNPENHARYLKLYAVFRDLYPALRDLYVRLAEAQ